MDWSFSRSVVFQVRLVMSVGCSPSQHCVQMSNVHSTSDSLLFGYLMGSVHDDCCIVHCCMAAGTEHSAHGREILGEINDMQLYLPAGELHNVHVFGT